MVSGFVLHLHSATQSERFEGVVSFVGEEASGAFGILPGHERMVASLVFGLARFRVADEPWQYLALPGAVLHFADNELFVAARRFLRDQDYQRIGTALRQDLAAEETKLAEMRDSVRKLEAEMLRRLWLAQREMGFSI